MSHSAALFQLNIDLLPTALRAATAVLWAYIFLFEWVALWRKRPFAYRAIPLTIALYGLYELTLLLTLTAVPHTNLLLALLGYAAASGFSAWALRRR